MLKDFVVNIESHGIVTCPLIISPAFTEAPREVLSFRVESLHIGLFVPFVVFESHQTNVNRQLPQPTVSTLLR